MTPDELSRLATHLERDGPACEDCRASAEALRALARVIQLRAQYPFVTDTIFAWELDEELTGDGEEAGPAPGPG